MFMQEMYLGFLLQMLTDPCGILLIQPLVLVVLPWVFIGLLLEFNNGLIICFLSRIQCTSYHYQWTFPIAFTSINYCMQITHYSTGDDNHTVKVKGEYTVTNVQLAASSTKAELFAMCIGF